jgi:hypothetical protein
LRISGSASSRLVKEIFDITADVAPIRALLDQGCDLEADVVPTVARTMPDLLRPPKRWDAPWLQREILAALDERFASFAQAR